jgi:hypothetical protein
MTRDEVIQTARTLAEKKGWPWVEPLSVEAARRFILFGRRSWRVATNTYYTEIGHNVHVTIDDETGQILRSEYIEDRTALHSVATL